MTHMTITHAEILKVVTEQLIIVMELEIGELDINMQSRFQDDLELESIEMIALGDAVKTYYNKLDRNEIDVDFAAWLSQLSIEQLMELSVGDLVKWLYDVLNHS